VANTIGVDGCNGGWIAASRDTRGAIRCWRVETLASLFADGARPGVVGLDVPIGLLPRGARECDVQARRLLGTRRSSVFPAPIRPMLTARSYADASRIRHRVEGKRVSIQAWGIMPKIVEVDRFLRAHPQRRDIVREVHPEVSFLFLNRGRPMRFAKKTREGRAERLALLRPRYGRAVESALADRGILHCQADDIIDAFAVLWTAGRIASGAAISIPAYPPRDAHGLRMEMIA
jgi:predicted RNase H-like nuclease